ncbi:MAG TPA: GNAT family N-acetyltransferase [Acidimicrobiales bacterium]|nr:GNAT family N-acetyltransferase [Acidimicrobiales bacterium]
MNDAGCGIRLRQWRDDPRDVAALAAAWRDPSVVGTNPVPADASPAGARRWIAGESERRLRGLALDLVISPVDDDLVWGEVGLRGFDTVVRRAEIGWWLAPDARSRGAAAVGVDLMATWALGPPLGLRQVWARISRDNTASARVAAGASFRLLGTAGGGEVWARS